MEYSIKDGEGNEDNDWSLKKNKEKEDDMEASTGNSGREAIVGNISLEA